MRFVQANIFLYFFLLALGISGFFFAVIWPQVIGFYAFIAFAAIGGFGVSLYIYHTKKHRKELVCPIGSDCNAVINSRYSKFLGIPLEYLGMFYYALIFSSYIILIFAPYILSELFLYGLIIFTAGAFLFSLYLLFAQAFILQQWCIWCILSATLSIVIFIISLANIDFAISLLAEITIVTSAIHSFGFALGIGAVTSALLLFSKFLRDLDINKNELQTLKIISELIWLGLAFIFISQFIAFIGNANILARSGPFLAQTVALFVVAISSAVLMIIFAPFLMAIPFNEKINNNSHSSFRSLRKPLFLTGAISFSSWYFAFIMNYSQKFSLIILLLAYIAVIVIAIATAFFWEKRIISKVAK
ncbi:MAG: vitamin K epoxide reductase family protein [Patescibacteria group bacterium]|mgnify:CR=1 FL=1